MSIYLVRSKPQDDPVTIPNVARHRTIDHVTKQSMCLARAGPVVLSGSAVPRFSAHREDPGPGHSMVWLMVLFLIPS